MINAVVVFFLSSSYIITYVQNELYISPREAGEKKKRENGKETNRILSYYYMCVYYSVRIHH